VTAEERPERRAEIRSPALGDVRTLRSFRCQSFGEPWSALVEEMIRDLLPSVLEQGDVEAAGLWLDAQLAGVTAWRIDVVRRQCRCVLVAVGLGQRRRGYGRILKQTVLDAARSAGADVVVSQVHWDNDAMIELNVALGANVEELPGDRDFCLCVIAV
jgi:GNAT superfamily N-acetyltransferase